MSSQLTWFLCEGNQMQFTVCGITKAKKSFISGMSLRQIEFALSVPMNF